MKRIEYLQSEIRLLKKKLQNEKMPRSRKNAIKKRIRELEKEVKRNGM